ncbi:SMP-30/gluconolactonase/LRE family protein [Plantactinospora sp. GCM10030261]|uniref:SMP-30/gluconolactonase/LRE family protein n=1 Tax=Plantactinospora sp. GCM10030261 TaxID=3273420 RepID=UPI00362084EE
MTRTRAPRLIRPVAAPASVPPPLRGVWAATDTRLDAPLLFPLPSGNGPEDVLVLPDGAVVSGGDDGRLWRWPAGAPPRTRPELLADTGGRPLGIELHPDGALIVCDAERGLLRVTPDGAVKELTGVAGGRPVNLCNNAAISRDGAVFFTDSSARFRLPAWKRDMLEYRPNGRLLCFAGGRTEVVVDRLYFPNGVALTPDESALLVAETSTHRLLRIPLSTAEPTVVADLPAYPDNVTALGDGTFWVGLPSPRLPVAERLLPHPRLRQAADLLPAALQPHPRRYGLAALVDADGTVRRTLHGPTGSYQMITSVRQHGDRLWLGSLVEPALAAVPA